MALSVSLGFSAHRLRPMIQALGPAWAELTSYSLGVGLIIAIFPTIFSSVLESANSGTLSRREAIFLAFMALVLSAGSLGTGVVLGWLVDPDAGRE